MAESSKKIEAVVQLSRVPLYPLIKETQLRFCDRKIGCSAIPPVRNGVS